MAEIRGTKWNDLDGDGVRDAGEDGLPGWTIFLDDNENGQLDAGETSTTTDANGDYAFTDLESHTYVVAEVVQPGFTQTFPTIPPSSQFHIDIVYTDGNLTPSQQAVFDTAADTWERIITGDLSDRPNFPLPSGGFMDIDDIAIEASAPDIDGPGMTLGQAGPRTIRGDNGLTITGIMQFDSADLAVLEANGQLDEVILHEMGHVLGIGTLWNFGGGRNLRTGTGTADPRYVGATGTAQYDKLSNNTETFIPVEGLPAGVGTRDSHWREAVFFNELMTGFLNGGINNPLSKITAGSLKDLGYEVDLRTAENYNLPLATIAIDPSSQLELDEGMERPEIQIESSVSNKYSFDPNAPFMAPAGTHVVTVGPNEVVEDLDFGNECFLTGTRILTENEEVKVEDLQIGDLVQTAAGKFEPIKWIGKQTVEPNQVKNPLRGYPVLIKAGALGNNIPCRDLYVSPDHSMFIDGLLINAGAIVNDLSILKTEPTETFTYYHIELENHSLLIAEGVAAESYLPQKEDRLAYDNGAEYEELYPQGSNLMLWPMDYPRISSRNTVPNYVSNKLLEIAYQLVSQEIKLRA